MFRCWRFKNSKSSKWISLGPIFEFLVKDRYLSAIGIYYNTINIDANDNGICDELEEVIFGYLFNIYKATACQIDKFVQGILNKIQSLMNSLLKDILGPLQDLLGLIASPLNMIGNAINYVLKLLGIQCSGPDLQCSDWDRVCTDGTKDDILRAL